MSDNDYRNRFKALYDDDDSDDISKLWSDQLSMQEEDKKLELELKLAKKKARELQNTLRRNKFGESKVLANSTFVKYKELLFNLYVKTKSAILSRRKVSALSASALVLILVVGVVVSRSDNQNPAILGESSTRLPIQEQDLPREQPTDFNLLYPSTTDIDSYDVVRISPDGADPSYTFLDRFTEDGSIFRVTQQEVPGNFDLSKTANDFQASNVIQVDEIIVYHGYSEKGSIQSLIFIKDNKLVSIRSPQRFSDDVWASYVISLK